MIRLVVLNLILLLPIPYSSQYTQFEVACSSSTPSCICPSHYNGEVVNVCEFSLNIQLLQSFTRYKILQQLNGFVSYGKTWFINETTGQFLPYPNSEGSCNMSLDDTKTCTKPFVMDGYTYRSFISVNGQFPGPTLIVNYNQTLMINVTNWLNDESVSIHWHGMNQKGTNWMDGVEGLTQCGILPGNTFTYIFQADPAGTYWYHSHTSTQRDDGLFGALIVKELDSTISKVKNKLTKDFIDIPEEHTLTLLDWQHSSSNEMYSRMKGHSPKESWFDDSIIISTLSQSLEPVDFGGTEGSPIPFWSGLINGKGRHINVSYNKTRLSVITISPSELYRFRIIGAQSSFLFVVSIDEHKLTVIATDGTFVKPVEVNYLIVHSGERYDVLVEGKTQSELIEKNNFIIRAVTLEPLPGGNLNESLQYRTDHIAEAILHYDITPKPNSTQYSDIVKDSLPFDCTIDQPCIAVNCPFSNFPPIYNISCIYIHELSLLTPYSIDELPNVIPDQYIFLNFAFEGYSGTSSVNARNCKLPSTPLSFLNDTEFNKMNETFCSKLEDPMLCDNNLATDIIYTSSCFCTHVITVSSNQSIQLVFSAVGSDPNNLINYASSHPIHLHGHHFHIVDVQFGSYDSTGRLAKPNTNIACGGNHLCTVPSWENGKDFSIGKTGKINSTSLLKDTVLIPAGGYVVVYIKTDNPGHWYLHCHVDPHLIEGMAVILSEAVEEIPRPPKGMVQCNDFKWSLEEYFDELNKNSTNSEKSSINLICLDLLQFLSLVLPSSLLLIIILVLATICVPYYIKKFLSKHTTKYQIMSETTEI